MTGVTQAVFMNQRSFGSGWIATLGGASNDYGYGITVDSSNNVYVIGHNGTDSDWQLAKYDYSGVIQWQKRLSGSAFDYGYGRGITVDSSGNVYAVGESNFSGVNYIQLAKYDASGSIQWQKTLGSSSSNNIGFAIAVDSSSNVYVTGYTSTGGTIDIALAKYNSSGTIQWQKRTGGSGGTDSGQGVAVDSSGNVYVVGYANVSGIDSIQLAKYNSSGTIQWQRKLGNSSNSYGYGIAVDSSNNVYITGIATISVSTMVIAKYNSSGTIQWQQGVNLSASTTRGRGVAVDSSGNVYVVGENTSGGSALLLVKYDSSGSLQWQRRLGSATTTGYGVAVGLSGNIYVVGYSNASGSDDFVMASLPNDGSKTGTYTVGGYSYTYAVSALNYGSISLTDASTSLTDAATFLTDSTSSLSNFATSLTSNTTSI